MKSRFAVVLLAIAFVACILNFTSYVFAESSDAETNKRVRELIEKSQKEKEKQHTKIESNLTDVEDAYKTNGKDAALKLAKAKGLKVKDNNKIRVHIILQPGISAEDFDSSVLEPYGVEVINGVGDTLSADVPIDQFREIADKVGEILYIETPATFKSYSYQSEAVTQNLIGSRSYMSSGLTGSGVKVAVIDNGFKGVDSAIKASELPAKDRGSPFVSWFIS